MDTNIVTLRDVLEADLPIFYEQQLDPQAVQMAGFPARDRDTFILHWEKILLDPSNILKTILFNDQVAGNIVSWKHEGEQEIGYWFGREYWSRGIATTALAEFLALIKMRPLYAYVVKHNSASRRILEKSGFILHQENGEEVVLRHT